MRFLFRLDLSLHAGAGKKIWNLEFGIQTRATPTRVVLGRHRGPGMCVLGRLRICRPPPAPRSVQAAPFWHHQRVCRVWSTPEYLYCFFPLYF